MIRNLLRLALLALPLSAVLALPPAASAADEPVRATLANGLQVVIVRNRLAPVVSTVMNYRVGGSETPKGFPGTAHALEHMMFRGSPGLTAAQLADIGSIVGGDFNANTQQSVTQYLYTMPATDLDIALRIEATRMRAISATQGDWAQERGAITQEVAQDLSSPVYQLLKRLRASMFAGTPYAQDPLGTKASFAKTTAADLKRFHDRWYAPNNAILVVAGDVEPQAALAKIRELFEPIPAKKLPARAPFDLRPMKRATLQLPSDLPYGLQVLAFRMPGFDSPDYPALELLIDVLKSKRGALYGLVPAGKALDVDVMFDGNPRASIGLVMGAFPSGTDARPLQAAIEQVLGDVAKNGVPPELVEAAKLQERLAAEVQKTSIPELAATWSQAVAVQGLATPDEDLARIEKVRVEDVNRVARHYLGLDHAIVATLTPTNSGKAVRADAGGTKREQITLKDVKPTALPDWARAAIERLEVPKPTLNPTVTRLANGITLVVQPTDVSDTVTLFGAIKNRPELQVAPGKEGVSDIAEALLPYGTQQYDRVALQREYDAIGADAKAGFTFAAQALSEHFERAVELLAQNELRPAFPEAAFKVVKQQVAQTVASRRSSPSYVAERALLAAVYPKDDPALRDATPESVASVTLDDVRTYYSRAARPDLATIVVVGNISPERARAIVEKQFGGWRAEGPTPGTDLPPVPPSAGVTVNVPDTTRIQSTVTLAQTTGVTRTDPSYYALQLGNTVLGGSFYSTRLTRDIRMVAGLVYGIDSLVEAGKTRGLYLVQYASDPGNVSRVRAMVVRELEQMQNTPVTDGELQRARALLLHRIPLAEASVSAIAQGIVRRAQLGLPFDEPLVAARRYLDLTANDVKAAFARHIRPGALSSVSRGPTPR